MVRDTGTNLSKAIFSVGAWHIVPAEHVQSWITMSRVSVICHQCPKWEHGLETTEGALWERVGYWTTAETVDFPCKLCGDRPPEAIVHLWKLHNFDTFCKDDSMARAIAKFTSYATRKMEGDMFIWGVSYIDAQNAIKKRPLPVNPGPDA